MESAKVFEALAEIHSSLSGGVVDSDLSGVGVDPMLGRSPVTLASLMDPGTGGGADFHHHHATYQTLNGRLSPGTGQLSGFPISYATLTPLQPLPPISTVTPSDRYGNGSNGGYQNHHQAGGGANFGGYSQPVLKYHHLQHDAYHQELKGPPNGGLSSSPPQYATHIPVGIPLIQNQQQQQHSIPTTYHQSYQSMTELRPLGVKQEAAAKFNGGNSAAISNNNNGYDSYLPASSSRTPSSGYGDMATNSPPPPAVMAVVNGLAGVSKQRPPRDSKKIQQQTQADEMEAENSDDGGESPVSSGGGEELNTKDLAQRISAELKRYSIPQAIFAQRVLCRSQGTLSDLLRNPKPWSKLKSGRETFRRMQKWLQEPEYQRMATLRLAGQNFHSFFQFYFLQEYDIKSQEFDIKSMTQS